jgi:hypothetical protein
MNIGFEGVVVISIVSSDAEIKSILLFGTVFRLQSSRNSSFSELAGGGDKQL